MNDRLLRLACWLALLTVVTASAATCTACAAAPLSGAVSPLALPTPGTTAPARTQEATAAATAAQEATLAPAAVVALPSECGLAPVAAPTMPAEIPGYAELDQLTGLHVTGSAELLAPATYQLNVTGKVDNPLSLTLDQLRCLPRAGSLAELTCPGFFVDKAKWTGASLAAVLALAGVQADATSLRLNGVDGYSASVPLSAGQDEGALLAYEWEGEPLPVLHGFPVRAVFPGDYGSAWVKWLLEIEVR